MPKISIFVFLLELYQGTGSNTALSEVLGNSTLSSVTLLHGTYVLLVCAFLSLVIGTVVGLGQYRFKRLMAYSTISHVGFLLLALAIANSNSLSDNLFVGEISVEAFLFYIVQYSLTNIDVFFVLLAFGYLMNNSTDMLTSKASTAFAPHSDVQFISELQGQFRYNPVLSLSLAVCLFSMAGVPPLVGFFAKYSVLYAAIHNNFVFLAVVAILASVVSAAYYLRVIRVIHFDTPSLDNQSDRISEIHASETNSITSVHSYIIASLTLFIMLFALNPILILNSTSIMALSLYTT